MKRRDSAGSGRCIVRCFDLVLAGVLAVLLSLVGLAGTAEGLASPDSVVSLSAPCLHRTSVSPPEPQPIEGHASTTDEPAHGATASRTLAHGYLHGYDDGWQPLLRVSAEQPRRCDGVGWTGSAFHAPPAGVLAAEARVTTGDVSVYTSTNAAGDINYVGITNNIARRAGEQLAGKGITINAIPGLTNLSRADARAVEQVLIDQNGGPGGQLPNKINSISPSNPIYSSSIQRGCQILSAVGYPAPSVC